MKKLLFILIFTFSSSCFSTVETGYSFLQKLNSNNQAEKQYLLGYVAGIYDAYENFDPSIYKCLGSSVKMSQIIDAISIYLKMNTHLQQYGIGYVFPNAIKEMYGCR